MLTDHPAAFNYLFDKELFLLNEDKEFYSKRHIQPVIEETQPVVFKYMGDNEKKFVVLVSYANQEFIEAPHLTALESTFKRKDLSLKDIAIVNLAHYPEATYQGLVGFFNPQKLLILGKDALINGFPAVKFNQIEQTDNKLMLYTFSFGEMLGNKENTKAFWEQVKNI